jgi:predicted transcriptional regulator
LKNGPLFINTQKGGSKMKNKERNEAIRLRKEEGLSIKKIKELLNVSQSTVSKWVRDVELSEEQKDKLYNNSRNGLEKATESVIKRNRDKRLEYQEEGRLKAKEFKPLHIMGCMLYWAEGFKRHNKNAVIFTNSDPYMIKIFIEFLTKELHVDKADILLNINCYVDNGIEQRKIEEYWLNFTGVSAENLRKTQINKIPKSSKGYKKNKLPYGVCVIKVHNTKTIQHIYGSIQEYCNFINDSWLNG